MKEKFRITGKGILSDKEYGIIKIEEEKPDLIYDEKIDQYREPNNQWVIPFHKSKK